MSDRIDGDRYEVSDEEREQFAEQGYVHLRGVLTGAEVDELSVTYDRFLDRRIEVPGKDYCDMAGDYGREPEDFSIINVMLPRRYHPAWQGNVYERRAASIAEQLCGPDMVLDYDQLLAKQPFKDDAVFAWHQDMAYWPETPDTRTATLWLAVDDSTIDNGCMRFVPAANQEDTLRPHEPVLGGRGESHALGTELRADDVAVPTPIARGDCTVHNERVLHGSGGNTTAGRRRAYVLAWRADETVRTERELGFTHSHNDEAEVLDAVGVADETRVQ
jgi:ectoine hydroxylase-related dioxygenase (phytanoyl-CoA dioxygenase family)